MAKLLSVSINLSKIDQSKIIEGKKGKYLNVTVSVKDEKNQHGDDVSLWQGQDKQEREAGQPKNYLGDGRIIWSDDTAQSNQSQQATEAAQDLDFLN